MSDRVYSETEDKMKRILESLQREFTKIRTGRASVSLLDGIKVDYYGTPTPINQVAGISIPEARLMVIQPWETKMLAVIEKAIQKADINISPVNDGKIIRLPIPQLTEERRKELVKTARRALEESKVSVRNIRREILETLKKMEKDGSLSEDEKKRQEENVQKLTDNTIKKLDELTDLKEKEILTI